VDPRSAEQLLDEPAGALAQLAAAGGAEFPNLTRARDYTAVELERRKEALADVGAAVVLFGSWGREELTAQSDDDWAVLGDDVRPDLLDRCRAVLGGEAREPGQQDLFGVAFSCDELTRNIGLDADTNTNLTRRMLLLLESRPIAGHDEHARCFAQVLHAYLGHGVRDYQPARFLLNDLIRYWRTICVDFEGKRRGAGGDDPKYASRNAKLRTSRKVLFAGGLLPVLLCQTKTAAEMPAFLTRQFAAPPTDRLAAAFILQGAVAEGVRALGAYDRWIGMLGDASIRAQLAALRESTREASPLFAQIREVGDELQRGLLALLYETGLSPLTRWYGLF
jgi:hypothetical protein